MTHKTVRPAAADATNGPRDPDQLAREINPSNDTSARTSQAPNADRVESDFEYFRRHPTARIRNRLAFPGEFSAEILAEGGGLDCFVRAIVERKPGRPIRRARWLLFVRGGGSA
jgi:hypothetical protein